jgi:hypothetical protein
MTGYSTALSSGYGQGTYVASSSSEYSPGGAGYPATWYAFDQSSSTYWASVVGYSTSPPYAYTASNVTVDVTGTSYLGEWLQIQMPSSIVVSNYVIYPGGGYTSQSPVKFWVLGSRDGTNWNLVDSRSGVMSWSAVTSSITFTVSSSQSFTYFRLVTNQLNGGGQIVGVSQWTLNGTIEGPAVSADGRLGLGVTNPTQALEVAGSAVVAGTLSAGNPITFKNRLINGNFNVWQRGTTFSVTTNAYTADRWVTPTNALGTMTISRSTNVPLYGGFQYSISLGSANAFNDPLIEQRIEQLNTYDLYQGTPITISFWACQTVGTPGVLYIEPLVGSTKDVFTSLSDACTPTLQTAQLSVNWRYYTFTYAIAVTTVATNGLDVQFWQPNAVNPATILLTGVQLEKGSVATPFEVRPFGIELSLCQRYYQEMPNTNGAHFTGGARLIGVINGTNGTNVLSSLYLTTPMRAAPAVTYYGGGSTSGTYNLTTASSGSSVSTAVNASSTATSQTAGNMISPNLPGITATGGSSQFVDMGWSTNNLGITLSSEL